MPRFRRCLVTCAAIGFLATPGAAQRAGAPKLGVDGLVLFRDPGSVAVLARATSYWQAVSTRSEELLGDFRYLPEYATARAQGQVFVAMEIPDQTLDGSSTGEGPAKGLQTFLSQLQNPAAGPMHSLQTILVTLDAATGLDLVLRASTDSPENGQLVYALLDSYLTMGRSMAQQNPQAAGILDHLELTHDGSNVEISVSMTGEDVLAAIRQSQPISGD